MFPPSGKGRASLLPPPSGPEVAHSQYLTPLVTFRGKEKNEVEVAIWGNVYTPPVLALPRTENVWGVANWGYTYPSSLSPRSSPFAAVPSPLRLHMDPTVAVQHAALGLCLAFHNKCMQLTVGGGCILH